MEYLGDLLRWRDIPRMVEERGCCLRLRRSLRIKKTVGRGTGDGGVPGKSEDVQSLLESWSE